MTRLSQSAAALLLGLYGIPGVCGGRYGDPAEFHELLIPLTLCAAIFVVMVGVLVFCYRRHLATVCCTYCCRGVAWRKHKGYKESIVHFHAGEMTMTAATNHGYSDAMPDNATPQDRLSGDGFCLSGDGLSGNGLSGDGLSGDGFCLSGDGLSRDGLSGDGLSGNGLSGNGLSGNGLSGDGLPGNGLSGDATPQDALSRDGSPEAPQHAHYNMELGTDNSQHAHDGMELGTDNSQHAHYDMELGTDNSQHVHYGMELGTDNSQRDTVVDGGIVKSTHTGTLQEHEKGPRADVTEHTGGEAAAAECDFEEGKQNKGKQNKGKQCEIICDCTDCKCPTCICKPPQTL